jgi:two-component system, NarL family, sensor histidine kinase UhpB
MERVETAVVNEADEAAECRRLAELLNLDAVGIVRPSSYSRRVTWWAAPGSGPLPLQLDDVLEGRAQDWIACPRGDDLVFARLTPRSSVRSVAALRGMLSSLAGRPSSSEALDDPYASERTRWAFAIHDGLTQVVTAAVLELEWMSRRIELDPTEATAALAEAATELRRALEEIRRMLAALSPDGSPQEGSSEEDPLEVVVQKVLERWRLPASWSIEGDLGAVHGPILQAASSVIREGVANAAKHSASQDVAVRVQATPQRVEVEVQDRGQGFQASPDVPGGGHLGLEMMRRLVAEVRGTLDIESSPGRGTRVVARLPVDERGDEP